MAEKIRRPRCEVAPLVEELQEWALDEVGDAWEIGGSWRRGSEMVGDLDVVLFFPALELVELPLSFTAERRGGKIAQGEMRGIHVDFWACEPHQAGPFLWFVTGPKELNIWMRSRALSMGMKLTQTELQGYAGDVTTERQVSDALAMPYLRPDQRADWVPKGGMSGGGTKITGESGATYELRMSHGRWSCTCPAFTYRRQCKHASDPEAWIERAGAGGT